MCERIRSNFVRLDIQEPPVIYGKLEFGMSWAIADAFDCMAWTDHER